MIIGNFHYDEATGSYAGSIRTLLVERDNFQLLPTERSNDREPDFRIFQDGASGSVEFGAAWSRQSEKCKAYLSVILDDPSMPHGVNAALFTDPDGSATLVWQRRSDAAKPLPESAPAPKARRAGVRQANRLG